MTSSLGEDSLLTLAWRCTQPTMMPFKMLIYCGMLSPPWSRTLRRVSESLSATGAEVNLTPRWKVGTAKRVTGVFLHLIQKKYWERYMNWLQINKWLCLSDCWNFACWQERRQHPVQKRVNSFFPPNSQTAILTSHTHTHSGTLTQWT